MSRHSLLLILLWSAFAFVLQLRPVDDVDLFWQIRLGQMAWEQGGLVTHDTFTYTHHGEPQPAIYWLAQLGLAKLYEADGLWLVRLVHSLFLASAFVLVGLAAPRTESLTSLLVAVVLAFLVGLSNSSVRPQGIAVFGFAALLCLAWSPRPTWQKLVIAAPIMLFWQNCHPSLVLGACAVGALAVAEWIQWLRRVRTDLPWDLTLLTVAALALQFATPMGFDVLAVSRTNLEIARAWLGVTEWQPPWDPSVYRAMLVFWAAFAGTLALAWANRQRLTLPEVIVLVVMTVLALSAARFALFWALALTALWARRLESVRPPTFFALPDRPVALSSAAGVCVVAWAWAIAGPVLLNLPVEDREIPLEGARRLHALLPAGRIYNYREWGGPLILENTPGWQIAIDGRLYLFPSEDEWREYNNAAQGRVPLEDLVRRHQPDAFFLRPTFDAGLIQLLRTAAEWREVYQDDVCVVFVCRERIVD